MAFVLFFGPSRIAFVLSTFKDEGAEPLFCALFSRNALNSFTSLPVPKVCVCLFHKRKYSAKTVPIFLCFFFGKVLLRLLVRAHKCFLCKKTTF